MPVLWFLAAAIALRADAPALTLAQAKAMSAEQLGNALLAPGHPVIVEARVGVQGMRPPPPPGAPFQSPIELIAAADVSSEAGFCERTVAHILLAPVIFQGGEAPPARPVQIETERTYSWMAKPDGRAGCARRHKQFFSVEKGKEQRALALVRSLAETQARAKSGRRVGAEMSIDDREAPRWREFARTNKDPRIQPTPEEMTPITDPKAALTQLPIGDISHVGLDRKSFTRTLKDADLAAKGGATREPASVFAGGEWSVDMALDGSRIAVVRITREVPPPF